MELKECALNYVNQGFSIFPLRSKSKVPAISGGFLASTTNTDIIDAWWSERPKSNIAIATGDRSGGIVVIDIDVDEIKGIDGRESIREWEKKYSKLPATATAITGRGGIHLYYKSSLQLPSKINLLDGVDIRANGGYVVAPGSIHENGREYIWDLDIEDYGIQPLPQSFIDLILKSSKSEHFEVQEEIKQGSRTNYLFKMVASMMAKGFDDDSIRLCIETENHKKCKPPLTSRELENEVFKALSRYKKGYSKEVKEQLKNKKAKQIEFKQAKEIPPHKIERPVQALELLNIKDLEHRELPPITFHIDKILADGVTILSAKSKMYKSWLCLQMAIAVARGDKLFGYNTVKSDVLYLDLENDLRITKDRLKKQLQGEPFPDNIYIVNEVCRLGDGLEEQLENILQTHPNIGLIIIDVLQYVRYVKERGENDYEADYKTFRYLKNIVKEKPISIICVHHSRKQNDDSDAFSNMLGSTALMGATDEAIVIHKKKRTDTVATISITGRTVESVDLVGRFNTDKCVWEVTGSEIELDRKIQEENYKTNPLRHLILKIMGIDGDSWESDEWWGTAADVVEMANKYSINIKNMDNAINLGRDITNIADDLLKFDNVLVTRKQKKIHGKLYRVISFKIDNPFKETDTQEKLQLGGENA